MQSGRTMRPHTRQPGGRGARRMAVINASSPLSGEAERAELAGILSEFRAALEEGTETGRRKTLAVRDGARNAR